MRQAVYVFQKQDSKRCVDGRPHLPIAFYPFKLRRGELRAFKA
jgi:hypothetical protein